MRAKFVSHNFCMYVFTLKIRTKFASHNLCTCSPQQFSSLFISDLTISPEFQEARWLVSSFGGWRTQCVTSRRWKISSCDALCYWIIFFSSMGGCGWLDTHHEGLSIINSFPQLPLMYRFWPTKKICAYGYRHKYHMEIKYEKLTDFQKILKLLEIFTLWHYNFIYVARSCSKLCRFAILLHANFLPENHAFFSNWCENLHVFPSATCSGQVKKCLYGYKQGYQMEIKYERLMEFR